MTKRRNQRSAKGSPKAKKPTGKRPPTRRGTTVGISKERSKLIIVMIGLIITVALVVSMLPSLPGPVEAPAPPGAPTSAN